MFVAMSHWFQISDSCDTINIGFSLDFLLVILLLPYVLEILELWISQTGPTICR